MTTELSSGSVQSAADPATTAPKPVRDFRYWVKRIMIDIVIGYVLLIVVLFFYQKKMVYQPSKAETLTTQEAGFAREQARDISAKTKDGLTIKGWHIHSRTFQSKGTPPPPPDIGKSTTLSRAQIVTLFFCGNAGNKSDRVDTFRRITQISGGDVVCFDYRGYGDSPGDPDEEGLALDARAAWDFIRAKNVQPQNIVIHGESLGGGVATRLASELCAEGTPPAALVLEATFTRLSAAGQKHFWFLPVALILTQKFPSVQHIPKLTCPLLQFHGTTDPVIPFSIGKELHDAAPAQSQSGIPKRFVELKCGHNDVGIVDSAKYREALKEFFVLIKPSLAEPPKKEK